MQFLAWAKAVSAIAGRAVAAVKANAQMIFFMIFLWVEVSMLRRF